MTTHSRTQAGQRAANGSRNSVRVRHGRALVECIVAALLLSVTTLAIGITTRGTLALSDDAQLISRAQSYATSRVENTFVAGCNITASGNEGPARIALAWEQTPLAATSRLRMDLSLERSPIATNRETPIAFTIEGGDVCH